MPGRINECERQGAVQLGRVGACDGSPVLTRHGICSSQSEVRCVGARAPATATAAAMTEAINVIDTRTKESSGFLPGCPIPALVEDDEVDVGFAPQGAESGQPPRSRRERVLQHPRNAVPLQDADDAECGSHAPVANHHTFDQLCRLVLHSTGPRIIVASVSKTVNAGEGTAMGGEHGGQNLALRGVLLKLSQNARACKVVAVAVKPLPPAGLKTNATHSTCGATDSTEEVGHIASLHARGAGPNGGDR